MPTTPDITHNPPLLAALFSLSSFQPLLPFWIPVELSCSVAFVWLIAVAETNVVLPEGSTLIGVLRVVYTSGLSFLDWLLLLGKGGFRYT